MLYFIVQLKFNVTLKSKLCHMNNVEQIRNEATFKNKIRCDAMAVEERGKFCSFQSYLMGTMADERDHLTEAARDLAETT